MFRVTRGAGAWFLDRATVAPVRPWDTGSSARGTVSPARTGRGTLPWRRVAVWVALGAMVFSGLVPVSSLAGAPTSVSGAGPGSAAATGAPPVPAAVGLPGQTTVGETPVDPGTMGQLLPASHNESVLPLDPSAHTTNRPVPAGPAPTPSPAPASSSVPTGYVTGTVVDSLPPHLPIAGVTVTASPLAGFCPSAGCIPVQTDPTGSFKVLAATGENVIVFQDAYYMWNRTWTYVSTDGLISVGTIRLVHDGFITGIVLGDDPAHEPLGGIRVTAQTRDGTFQAVPESHTDGSGRFVAAVPPVPTEVVFATLFPYSVYETNYTWVNVSAGATLNIGAVYLEKMSIVTIRLVDVTTGKPVGSQGALQVVSRVTGYQPAQGAIMFGPTLVAQAPPGPDTATIYAAGYLVDQVTLGVVPRSAPGVPVFMGTFSLVPLGQIQMNAGVMGENLPGVQNAESYWGIGIAFISACSLNGEATAGLTPSGNLTSSTCTGGCDPYIGQSVYFGALPLRNYITVQPDTSGICGFFSPTWPIPGYLPVFENYAWANVTPNFRVNIGMVNMLPGTYVEGQVLPGSQSGWDVIGCSTDQQNLCGPGVLSDQAYQDNFQNFVPSGCVLPGQTNAAVTFCAPVPPGPSKVTVTPNNASSNYTWVETGLYDYTNMPEPLHLASALGVRSINLTAGTVSGRVLQALSRTPIGGLPVIKVCPAGTTSGSVSCGSGVADPRGYFNSSAPFGWDRVTVSATEYASNSTYVYVRSANQSGTILLTPYSYINGQVTDLAGAGIRDASVQVCPVTNPTSCAPLGTDGGLTSTNGYYFGTVASGYLPRGAYEVEAAAAGYQSDWTWVNVTTPGQNFTAPTIRLQPLLSTGGLAAGSPYRARAAPGNMTSFGAWVTGRVDDAKYGIGLNTAQLVALPVLGGAGINVNSVRGTGGEFNDSLPNGAYTLTASLAGYYPTTIAFNVTGNDTTVDLGTISLQPFPTIVGRLLIDPWRLNVTEKHGLGPGVAQVTACTALSSPCGPGGVADTSGFFNVSAPAGTYDVLFAQGKGTGPGTLAGGFVTNSTSFNITNSSQQSGPPLVVGMPIFGTIVGSIVENATRGAPLDWFDTVLANSNNPTDATQGETINATGDYAIFFTPSLILNMTAGGQAAFVPQAKSFSVTGTLDTQQPPILPAGGVANLNNVSSHSVTVSGRASFALEHYGWIDARVIDAVGGAPIPYATLAVQEPGSLWGLPTTLSASGAADGYGFVNLTAPPSIPSTHPLLANITSPDYTYATSEVFVNSSRTTYLNGTGPTTLHGFGLRPWGWVVGFVSDATTGAPLSGANPVVTDPTGLTGASGATTNGLGYFRIDAPPNPLDHLTITSPGFVENSSFQVVGYGATVPIAAVHLVGYGIVQGQVISYPTGAPVSGASVSVCPRSQPNCSNLVSTNVSGFFAVAAPPGVDVVKVSATRFVTNLPQYVTVLSDTWSNLGLVTVFEFAHVTGYALGIPGGGPLFRANASLCAVPTSGTGAGPCFVTSTTGYDGSFRVQAPAGTYVLDANATFYNDTFLTISVSPGESLSVGTLFLSEFGTATGAVFSSDGNLPLPGAQVLACEAWALQHCRPAATAGPDGRFVLSGPPGPYVVQATATGYQAGFQTAVLPSGGTVTMPPFVLIPIGPGNQYPVTGVVVDAAAGTPLPGAVVTATGGFSTTVTGAGTFSMTLPWGVYTLAAQLPGYLSSTQTVTVYGSVQGIHFSLVQATYVVSGTVRDGLTGFGVGGVTFHEVGGAVLGSGSGTTGAFTFSLPNGTYSLVATPKSSSALYASVPFGLVVNGAPAFRNFSLYPTPESLDGLVVNSLTGVSIAGASVTLSGSTQLGVTWTFSATSGPDGRFLIPAYPGSYTLQVRANGYQAVTMSMDVSYSPTAPSRAVSVPLSPVTATAPASGVGLVGATWVIGGVGGAVVVGGLLWVFARRRTEAPAASSRPGLRAGGSPPPASGGSRSS